MSPTSTDPDGDAVEAILWVDPADLPGNPMLRPELAADLDVVMAALGIAPACCGGECCQDGGCCGGAGGCTCGGGELPKAEAAPVAKATIDLSDGHANLTGVWREVYDRRAALLARHQRAVAAAWDACMAELGSPRSVVREFRSGAGKVAKLADPDKKRWQDVGTAAALAWLERLRDTKGWAALVAALETAIRDGMAEGEADALALAADRQGVAGFGIAAAFTAAAERLQGDPGITRQAQDAADGIIASAARDAGRALAGSAEDGDGEDEMTSDVEDATSGGDATDDGTDWWVYAAIGAGALAFYQSIGSGAGGGNAADVATILFITAGDSRVCPVCAGYEDGSPYTAGNVPPCPVHPRCRCSLDTTSVVPQPLLAGFFS